MAWTLRFSDLFTEASDTNLDSHTPNTGSSWSKNAGPSASHAKVIASDDTLCHPYHSGTPTNTYYTAEISGAWAAKQKAEATKPQAGNANVQLAVRLSANDDGYGWYWNGGSSEWRLIRHDNGVDTTIATSFQASPGTLLQGIEADGSTITGTKSGAVEASTTDATYSTGKPGVVTIKSLASAGTDAYEAYDEAAPGTVFIFSKGAAVIPPRGKSPDFLASTFDRTKLEVPIARFPPPRGPVPVPPSLATQIHAAAERALVQPFADIPVRARGGVSEWTQVHTAPEREFFHLHFDVPVQAKGGTSEWTQVHQAPERPLVRPHADVPIRAKGGTSEATQFHSEPTVAVLEIFHSQPETPQRRRKSEDFVSEFHDVPPPPPEFAFLPSAEMPRRFPKSPDYLSIALGVSVPFAMVRRGVYDDWGLYSRDV